MLETETGRVRRWKVANMASLTACLVYTAGIKKMCCILKTAQIKVRFTQKVQAADPQHLPAVNTIAKQQCVPTSPSSFNLEETLYTHAKTSHEIFSISREWNITAKRESNLHLTECGSATLDEFFSSCPSLIGAPVIRYGLLIITANANTTSRADCCCSFKLDPLGGREHVWGLSSPPTNGKSQIKRERIYRRTGQWGRPYKTGWGFVVEVWLFVN